MILEYLGKMIAGVYVNLLGLAPRFDTDDVMIWADEVHNAFAAVWKASGWIPVGTMFAILGILLVIRLAIFVYLSFHHVWKALPFT
jgi:hypothetical protein